MDLNSLKQKALEDKVPIISDESLEMLINVLNTTNSRSLLEIGAAIGYSALKIKRAIPDIDITTIERDTMRYTEALTNINQAKENINLINADALKYNVDRVYDAIFVDGAKAQNISFFKLYFAYVDKVMIIDNTNYHGFVDEHYDKIYSRRFRRMINKIREFKEYLNSRTDIEVTELDIGDGLIIVKRK